MITTTNGLFISIVLISALLTYDIIILSKNKYNASVLFLNIHIVSVSLFLLYGSTLLKPMDYYTLFVILSYTFFFPIGYAFSQKKNHLSKIKHTFKISQKNKCMKLYVINNIGFLFFIFAYGYELYIANFIPPIFAQDKLTAYYNFPQNFVHYLVISGLAISGVYIYLAEHYHYKRKIIYLLVFIIFIAFVMTMARSLAMAQVLTIIFIVFKERKIRLSVKKLSLIVTIALLFITISGTLRTGEDIRALFIIGGLESWPTWSLPFAWIYLYFTTSIENFREYVHLHDDNFRYGVISFLSPLANLLQMKDSDFFTTNLTETSAGGFNTSGYYTNVYLDFGALGFLYTFFLGYISGKIFNSKNLTLYLFSPFWLYAIFTSSMNTYFNAFFTLVYLAYYFLAVKLSDLKFK